MKHWGEGGGIYFFSRANNMAVCQMPYLYGLLLVESAIEILSS